MDKTIDQTHKPMRQFTDEPLPQKHSWSETRIFLFVYIVAPLLVIPCIAVTGYRITQKYYSQPISAEAKVEEPSVDEFVNRYVEALGGVKALERLEQLSFTGAVYSDRDRYTFEGVSSRSDGYAVRFFDLGAPVTFDLKGATYETLSFSTESSSEPMVNLLEFIFSDFYNPAIRHLLDGSGKILSVSRDNVGRVDLVCLEIEAGLDLRYKLYFNERTMELVARRDIKDSKTIRTFRYSNYKIVRGISLPHTVVVQVEDMNPVHLHYSILRSPHQLSGTKGQALVLDAAGKTFN